MVATETDLIDGAEVTGEGPKVTSGFPSVKVCCVNNAQRVSGFFKYAV